MRTTSSSSVAAGPLVVLLGAQLAVASAALLARAGLKAGLEPLPLTAWRLAVAVGILLPLLQARKTRSRETLPARVVLRLVGAGVLLGLHFWAWFASLQDVSVARSTLLVSTTPVWAALGAWVLTRRAPPRSFWLALAVSGLGAWMVTGGPGGDMTILAGGNALRGDLLATLGAVCIGAYLVLTADLQERLGTWRVVAWTYATAAVVTWAPVPALATVSCIPSSTAAWWAIVGLALVPQLIGHTSLNWSLRHFSAGAVGTATLLEPVFAGALAWALLGERLSTYQIAGAAILLCGIGAVLAVCDTQRRFGEIKGSR